MDDNRPPQKILIASPFFYPEPISTGKYNTFLAEKLVEKGHDVTVICSYPLYPGWKPEFTNEGLNGLRVLQGGLNVTYPKSAVLRRLVLETWFALHFFRQARRIKGTVDTVVGISPPVLFTFFVRVLFKRRKKLVIVHDLLGIMATSSDNRLRRLVASIMKTVESAFLRSFDTVICLSESMKEALVTQYRMRSAVCRVHYPFATMEGTPAQEPLLEDAFPPGFHHIVYSGAMGEKQRPRELYTFFMGLCEARSDICCHIFSRGPIADEIRKGNTHRRILFHDLVPESQLAELYARSDIQVVPQAEGTGAGAFPSKIPNLIAAGVPVLAICDQGSELARIIRETGAGVVVSGWDFERLRQAVDGLLARESKEAREKRKGMAQRYIREMFDVNRLVECIAGSREQGVSSRE